jgi:hypothetical protein
MRSTTAQFARPARRRAHERHHAMPFPLRLAGLLISIGLALTACDAIAGYVESDIIVWVIAALLLVALVGFLVKRMRRRP